MNAQEENHASVVWIQLAKMVMKVHSARFAAKDIINDFKRAESAPQMLGWQDN